MSDKALKLSASLSYYTIFSLGPLLMIVISCAGIFLGEEAVKGKLYGQIESLVGSVAASAIQGIIQNIQVSNQSVTGAIIGLVVLFIGATGVFTEIQDSINFIWSIRAKPKKNWLYYITNRLLSFSLVIGMAFLLMVSLLINTVINLFSDFIGTMFPDAIYYLVYILNNLLTFIIISGLFSVVYKVLPDAKIAWRDAIVGSCFTGIMFIIGKLAIGYYIGNSHIGITYGAAASIIIILLWVYYSSIILYFGAEFTKIYATTRGKGITPNQTAVFIVKTEAKEIQASYDE